MHKHAFLWLALITACAHTGRGEGDLTPPSTAGAEAAAPEGSVAFTWRSGLDASDGELQATLPSGEVFTGPYQQIRADMETDTTGPYFAGWSAPAWANDPFYGPPPTDFEGANTGKVVAFLKGAHEDQMRCKFQLRKPEAGMTGGGMGTCLLSDKEQVLHATLQAGSRN